MRIFISNSHWNEILIFYSQIMSDPHILFHFSNYIYTPLIPNSTPTRTSRASINSINMLYSLILNFWLENHTQIDTHIVCPSIKHVNITLHILKIITLCNMYAIALLYYKLSRWSHWQPHVICMPLVATLQKI